MIRALPVQRLAARPESDPHRGDAAEGAAEILRQALAGFLPPAAALFTLFDRMETQR